MHEHVVGKAVAAIDALEIELLEDLAARGRVPGLRVGDVPVAGRNLRQEGQHRVAEVARARNHAPRFTRDQPVRLRVVDLAAHDGQCDLLQVGRIHLVVGRHHTGDVDSLRHGPLIAGHDRRAYAGTTTATVLPSSITFTGGV